MITEKIVLRFSSLLVEQPIIYRLVKDYDLVVNILKAEINPHREGFVVLELSGDPEQYNRGLEYIKSLGVSVEPLSGTIVWLQERCLQCGACTTSVRRERCRCSARRWRCASTDPAASSARAASTPAWPGRWRSTFNVAILTRFLTLTAAGCERHGIR